MDKPPLGVLPRYLWDEQRMVELTEAINRFMDVGEPVPQEWFDELLELTLRVIKQTAERFGITPQEVVDGMPEFDQLMDKLDLNGA